MKISVIIATFRRGNSLISVLQDLEKIDYSDSDFEIVVVDQTPQDEYAAEVYCELKKLENTGLFRWIYYPRNYVYEARNYGAAVSLGDYLFWLDDDVRVGSDLLNRFMRCFKENSDISIVQGGSISENALASVSLENSLVSLQDRIDKAFLGENKKRRDIEAKAKLLEIKPELQAFYCEGGFSQSTQKCAWLSANNMMIERSAFDRLHGWDEYILNYGDRNLGIRAAKLGLKIHWYPDAAIVHIRVPTGGSRMSDPNNPIKGWRACVSIWYIAFRYLRLNPIAFAKFGIYKAARYSFLLKKNFQNPKNLIFSLSSYQIAAAIGFYWSLKKPLSSYPMWRTYVLDNGLSNLPEPLPLRRVPQ